LIINKMKTNKKNKYLKSIFSLVCIIVISSCEQMNGPTATASAFCDCLKKNGAPKQAVYARAVCDGEFIQRNRLYKLYRIDIRYGLGKLSNSTLDSVWSFMKVFSDYTKEHCCDVVLECNGDTIIKK